jgi:2-hydroxychromene-2-carboxylate isomerase
MSRAKSLYILQDVRRLARLRGLEMTWPVDRAPRWEVAHLAYLVAQRHDAGRAFVDAVYRARWQSGRNISDPDVIAAIGAQIGLDPVTLRRAGDDPDLREEGLNALRALVHDGVFGVPLFICGREKFWGVDRLADFAAMVRVKPDGTVSHDSSTLLRPAALGADQGHAGGCG